MKPAWLVYIIWSAVGLRFRKSLMRENPTMSTTSDHEQLDGVLGYLLDYFSMDNPNDRSSDIADPNEDYPERPTLLLTPKQMWASGLDARRTPSAFFNGSAWAPLIWTQKTVDVFGKMYDAVMNPKTCVHGHQTIIATKPYWGLTSRVRDFQDILMGGALNGKMVLPENGGGCPDESENRPDPFMACIFEPFSRCQLQSALHPNSTALDRMEDVEDSPETFLRPVLDVLLDSGLTAYGHVDVQPVGHQYLGVIRSLLQTTAFKFASPVEDRVAELESTFGELSGPMLIVHIRRTDKVTDSAQMPEWFDVKSDADRVSLMQSLDAILELIPFVESRAGEPYKSVYLMTDDPRFFKSEYLSALQHASAGKAVILYNPFVVGAFDYNNKWLDDGHTSQTPKAHNAIDIELAADMRFAIKHGSHIIGCGRSGISQFIAQGLGAKFMVDPNAVSAFEDDSVLLPQVMGKTEAEKHLQKLSATFASQADDNWDLDYNIEQVLKTIRVNMKQKKRGSKGLQRFVT